jgi:hypothetical protein
MRLFGVSYCAAAPVGRDGEASDKNVRASLTCGLCVCVVIALTLIAVVLCRSLYGHSQMICQASALLYGLRTRWASLMVCVLAKMASVLPFFIDTGCQVLGCVCVRVEYM